MTDQYPPFRLDTGGSEDDDATALPPTPVTGTDQIGESRQ